MPDIQVSNARRVGFTAMAVVMFVLVTMREYWIAVDAVQAVGPFAKRMHGVVSTAYFRVPPDHSLPVASLLAIVPTLFLLAAESNSVRGLLRPSVLVAVALFFGSVLTAGLLGLHDGDVKAARLIHSVPEGQTVGSAHAVSWPWLLLPIILTTAFVIYGAWRSAVRAAATQPVEEDE